MTFRFARPGFAGVALIAAALPLSAQARGCPDGTTEIRRQSAGDTIVVYCRPPLQPAGNGLILGMGAIEGGNAPPGASPRVRARLDNLLRSLRGSPAPESLPAEEYNFVLGIAESHNEFVDLGTRVVLDQLTNGRSSARNQEVYASLRGRSFDRLDCHSNGAMICLAALLSEETTAKEVRLLGPQITPDALELWNSLLESQRVGKVTVVVNVGDPVPLISYAFGMATRPSVSEPISASFRALRRLMSENARSVQFELVSSCELDLLPFAKRCHDNAAYQKALAR